MNLTDLCADILLAPLGMDHNDLPPRREPSADDLDRMAEEERIREQTK